MKHRKKTVAGVVVGVLLAVDMFINGITGGSFHETISFRAATSRPHPVAEVVCFVSQFVVFEWDHCDKVLERNGGKK